MFITDQHSLHLHHIKFYYFGQCQCILLALRYLCITFAGFDGKLLSLALSYTVTISYVVLTYIMWSSAEVETYVSFYFYTIIAVIGNLFFFEKMVSTERVLAYSKLKSEAPLKTELPCKIPPDWPHEGCIELSDVSYRHSPTGPIVLKKINITILASEKVR